MVIVDSSESSKDSPKHQSTITKSARNESKYNEHSCITRLLTRGETEISGHRLKLVGDDVEPAWPVLSVKLLSLYDKYS